MKRPRFNHVIMLILIILSILFFGLQQLLFHDIYETEFLFFQDLLFLPLEILLVTFVLEKVLQSREKRERLEQMNIVISAFFSDVGIETLKAMNPLMLDLKDIRELLDMGPDWDDKDFTHAAREIKNHAFRADIGLYPLERLKEALLPKKTYVLQMFNNPNLLEHNTFTDLLWALYHVINELENRADVRVLPRTDTDHLSGDVVRAYGLLVYEWIFYMRHLKGKYPYLWSLAVRKNPFAENSVIVV